MSAGYERFSAQDSSFLVFEDPNTHMHLGGIAIFDPGPLATADGGVDNERIRRHVESRLHWIPRYRQRVAYVPLERHPVWVDDDHFNLSYHVRHTSLPRPGDEEQLKRLAGRIMSQRLDRRRPLWESWIVEGREGGRFPRRWRCSGTRRCARCAGRSTLSAGSATPSSDPTSIPADCSSGRRPRGKPSAQGSAVQPGRRSISRSARIAGS